MQITDVEALYLRLPEIKARTDSSQDALPIRVTTDAGLVDWGEVDSCPWVIEAIVEAPSADRSEPPRAPARLPLQDGAVHTRRLGRPGVQGQGRRTCRRPV